MRYSKNPTITDEYLSTEFTLEQNFPNPFNPATTITYSISTTSNVSIKLLDILGNELQTLVNELKSPGEYS